MSVRALMRCVLIAQALAACGEAAEPAGRNSPSPLPGIVGDDDRRPWDSAAWPWHALGRLNQPDGRTHCTAALVARDTVLTAAHCLYDRHRKRWLAPGELVFVAGYRRGEDAGFAHGRAIRRSSAADPQNPTVDSVAEDWAVVLLDRSLPLRPIPVKSLPPASALAGGAAGRFSTAGYAQDRPHLLSRVETCAIAARLARDRVLLTDCDSTHGDSGAPLLLGIGPSTAIVGVFSAATSAGGAAASGTLAVHAAAFISALDRRWGWEKSSGRRPGHFR